MSKIKLNSAIASLKEYLEGCLQQPFMQNQHLSGAGATYFLEEKLKVYYNKKYAVTFSNATTALQTLCIALNLHNNEILTSPINWGGSVAPFLLHGNKLRFTSFDPFSLNLSMSDLPLAVTHKTKTLLSVDFNGTPVDSETIKTFCSRNNLIYISDSAQSLGSSFNNKPAGYYADAIVLSFSPGKLFFAGEGGAVITDDDTIYEKLLWYSQHPSRQKTVFGLSNYNDYSPVNGRMNPLSAILLNETFEHYILALKELQEKSFCLIKQLHSKNFIEDFPHIQDPMSSTFFSLVLKFKDPSRINELNDFLKTMQLPIIASKYLPRLIPFDSLFRFQNKRMFSCSKSLSEQNKIMPTMNWIRLNYSN